MPARATVSALTSAGRPRGRSASCRPISTTPWRMKAANAPRASARPSAPSGPASRLWAIASSHSDAPTASGPSMTASVIGAQCRRWWNSTSESTPVAASVRPSATKASRPSTAIRRARRSSSPGTGCSQPPRAATMPSANSARYWGHCHRLGCAGCWLATGKTRRTSTVPTETPAASRVSPTGLGARGRGPAAVTARRRAR